MRFLSMTFSDILTIIGIAVTCIIALIGGVYAIITDTKKFELAEVYKKDLFSWYSRVMFSIAKLETCSTDELPLLLNEFRVLIDIGRFYFPNDIYREPLIGRDRERIHWGYRQLPLDFLVLIYNIVERGDVRKKVRLLHRLKDEFSSSVFLVIAPEERIRYIEKHTEYRSLPKEAIEDYLTEKGIGEATTEIFKYYW